MSEILSPSSTSALPHLSDVRLPNAVAAISPTVFTGLIRITETAVLAATGLMIATMYVAESDLSGWHYLVASPLTALAASSCFHLLGCYSIDGFSNLTKQLPRLLLGWIGALGLLVASMFFLKAGPDFSRVWVAVWFVVGLGSMVGLRLFVQRLTQNAIAQGRFARRAVIYGCGPEAERLIKALEQDAASDVRICGLFDDRDDNRSSLSVAGYPKRGNTEALVTFCRDNSVDMVIVALPLAAEARVADLMRHIDVLPADVRIAGTSSRLRLSARAYSYIGNVPMLDLSDKPISDWNMFTKSAFDRAIATLALIALSPVMALVALAVKIESKGPVLFRQKRYGFNNELIEVLKFRSMYTDRCDATASKLVTKDDPRVTRVGRIIRKTSLDELPQLFNVLTGQLSLVGPRPHAVKAQAAGRLYPDVVDGYFRRHKVKPGITGWAQINGWRGETDTPEKIQKRVEHDIHYIEHWSIWLDIQILARTPASLLLNRDNAY